MSAAVDVPWEGDFSVDELGNTNIAEGDIAYVQRLIRRLLTSPRLLDAYTKRAVAAPDYIFEPEFGAGLRRLINMPVRQEEIQRLVSGQILADEETSKAVRPDIRTEVLDDGSVFINIIALREPNVSIAFGLRIV